MRNLKVLLIAFIATTTVVLGGNAVKKFQENSIRFGRDADQRRIVFDYEEDGTSAIISVDPSDEYFTFNNRVDLADELHVQGLTQINNRFVVVSTAFPSRPCPIMTTAERDLTTPAEADCIYQTDDNQLEIYDGVEWIAVGSGSGTGGLDTFYTQTFEKSSFAIDSSGNNATWDNGGSLDGVQSIETVAPISGKRTFEYTGGASSNNDWIKVEVIDLDLKQRGEIIKMRLMSDSSSFANDITVVVYDETNSAELTTSLDKITASLGRTFYEYTFETLDSTAQISWGVHMNNGVVNAESYLIDDLSSRAFE